MPTPYSTGPLLTAIYVVLLAFLVVLSGILLSQTDKMARRRSEKSRIEEWTINSLRRRGMPIGFIKLLTLFLEDIDGCRKCRGTISSLTLFHVIAGTLAFMVDENDAPILEMRAFSDWVNRYLNPLDGAYIYPGDRLFVSRNGLVDPSRDTDSSNGIGGLAVLYSNHGEHCLSGQTPAHVEVISIWVLMRDTHRAVKRVVEAIENDDQLLDRARRRWVLIGGLRQLVEAEV
jgi:hypothetical protein